MTMAVGRIFRRRNPVQLILVLLICMVLYVGHQRVVLHEDTDSNAPMDGLLKERKAVILHSRPVNLDLKLTDQFKNQEAFQSSTSMFARASKFELMAPRIAGPESHQMHIFACWCFRKYIIVYLGQSRPANFPSV